MRIGYFTTLFPYPGSFSGIPLYPLDLYPWGGSDVVAYHLARNMVKLGHEVSIFTSSVDSSNHIEESEGMRIYRYGTNFKIKKAFFSLDLFLKSIKHDVDIVHLHYSTPPGILASFFYAKVTGKPYIITYHGDMPENFGNLVRRVGVYMFNRLCVHKILSSAKLIISPSEYYISQSQFLSKHREATVTIPNGIDSKELEIAFTKEECKERLSLGRDDMIIFFIGALMESKNPHLLIKAMPAILGKIPNTKLVIAGVGSMRQDLENLTEKLGLSHRVIFAGGVTGELKAMYYKAADVFVLPSVKEVFPIVLLEAATANLPMLVSDLSTFRCLIEDGDNGLMVHIDDEVSLVRPIINLLSDSELRERLGTNANIKVKDFFWEKIAKTTEEAYKAIINNA